MDDRSVDYDSAKLLLLRHGSGTTDVEGNIVVAEDGFLQMLRPYRGLKEGNFHTVLQALFVVGDRFHTEQRVERELMNTLWAICSISRAWGLHAKGMLQRNSLITETDTALLEEWIDTIERSIEGLLSGCPPYYRITNYAEYITRYGAWSNISFFVPYMVQYLEDDRDTTDPTAVANALGCIGHAARPALPALHAAARRVYADWCNDEAQTAIASAISQIEASTQRNHIALHRSGQSAALYVSQLVVDECSGGDVTAASERLAVIETLPFLQTSDDVDDLSAAQISAKAIPHSEPRDAFHIAISAVNGVNYLLTWNFKHIANASLRGRINQVCHDVGFDRPGHLHTGRTIWN